MKQWDLVVSIYETGGDDGVVLTPQALFRLGKSYGERVSVKKGFRGHGLHPEFRVFAFAGWFFFGFLDLGLMGGRGYASAVGCRHIPCSVQKS